MTAISVTRPNRFALAIGGLLSGVAAASWFILFHFIDKWKMTNPRSPTGEFVYAHVEHGGVIYFNAIQSIASHLYIPVWLCLMLGILIANAAYGESAFRRRNMTQADLPILVFQAIGAGIAIAVIYFYGHEILNALIDSPFKPGNDDLTMVDRT